MLELIDVSLTLSNDTGDVEILKNINLTLDDKKLYVLTGPNGGGKSSLAKVIMGIYKPTTGRILLNGNDITSLSITERARLGLGYAFQQPPRFKGMTVEELLKIAIGNDQPAKAGNLLFDVGLCPQTYLKREANGSLSGGELKRVEIATLLARNLSVAVFDEPEAGIDLWSFSKLTETFQKLHDRYDTTIVIISHQERILNMADEIILIADGRVEKQGDKDTIWPLIMEDAVCTYQNCCERAGENAECNR